MLIDVLECESKDEWDSLIGRSLNPTYFHTWEWLKLAERHSGWRLHPLIAKLGTNELGVFPMFSKTKNCVKEFSSPPPKTLTPYLGPLMVPYDKVLKQQTIEKTLLSGFDSFNEYLEKKLNANHITVSTSIRYDDARPLLWNGYNVAPRYRYVMDLNGSEGHALGGFKGHTSDGITVKPGGKKELDLVFEHLPKPAGITKGHLHELFDRLHPKNLRVTLAESKGEFAGGLITVSHQGGIVCLMEASAKDTHEGDAILALHHETVSWALKGGFKSYDLGEANVPGMALTKLNPRLAIHYLAEKHRSNPVRFIKKLMP